MTTYDIKVTSGADEYLIGSVFVGARKEINANVSQETMCGRSPSDGKEYPVYSGFCRLVSVYSATAKCPLDLIVDNKTPDIGTGVWAPTLAEVLVNYANEVDGFNMPEDTTQIHITTMSAEDKEVATIMAMRAVIGQGRIQSFQQWYVRAEVSTTSMEHPTRLHSFNVYLNKPDTSWVHLLAAVFKKLAEMEHHYTGAPTCHPGLKGAN